jgi:dTDP-4-amino-4,6-dideoxygalactose transaminase
MYNWFLNDSNFTWSDRFKICKFFLDPKNRWTQDKYVLEYEEKWKKLTSAKYALMVSSGSTANTLIAKYAKHSKPDRNIVVFPSVTWQTSVSPWISAGFEPHFIDINLEDFSIDINKLTNYLKKNNKKVNTVFVTSLIGITPDIPKLKSICKTYGVELKLDNCENSFGAYFNKDENDWNHICSELTSSTSTYFGHQTTTGSEGGMVFTNNEEEFVYYILARSHGLTRELKKYNLSKDYQKSLSNKLVDPLFDFNILANNYRSTNIAAFIGLLDFDRVYGYIFDRTKLYDNYKEKLDTSKYLLPEGKHNDVAFCLPIISKKKKIKSIKKYLQEEKIEYRPIISGNLLRHTCYKKYADYKEFKNAEYIHKNGVYVGLHSKVEKTQIDKLVDFLNSI